MRRVPPRVRAWYQLFMRALATCIAMVLCAACGQPAAPEPPGPPSQSTQQLNPGRVDRVRSHLPDGYEVTDLTGRSTPVTSWGLGPRWTADPEQCGSLADPVADGTTRGWSASGSGGIVHAVVVPAAVVQSAESATALTESCGAWTVSAGPTTGRVTLIGAPAIDGATTLGMAVDAATVVEGGTETRSHADTFTAYAGGYVAFVTVVTDPGAAGPALTAGFASNLLVETVAAIRG